MDTNPETIIANEFENLEEQIRNINKSIKDLFHAEYQSSVLDMAYSGKENATRWETTKREIQDLYTERQALRIRQRTLRAAQADPQKIKVYAQSLLDLIDEMDQTYKADETTPE